MLTIRLQRIGRKNEAAFRVILTDSKNAAKTGKFLDILGSYNPKSGEVVFKADEIKRRIADGVTVSDTVNNFLVAQKIITGKKVNVLSKKSPTKKRKEAKS
jgi:small subunit ribosomal protein S16